MKSTFYACILFLLSALHAAPAQTISDTSSAAPRSPFAKRTYALTGSVSYNSTSYDDPDQSTTTFNVAPSFLYFTSAKFAWGGQIVYTALSSRSKYGKSGTAVMGVGPSFRLYPLDAAPLLFFSASVYMTSISSYSGDISISGPTSSYGAVSIGYDILTSSMFAFEPYIEYRSRILENATAAGGVTFGVTFVSFHP